MIQVLQTLPNVPQDILKAEVYACSHSYRENYRDGPQFSGTVPSIEDFDYSLKNEYRFLGFPLENPLGVPAGPLLNAQWVKFYLDFGFAVPVYKTVRSVFWDSAPPPNCIYIATPEGQLDPLQPLPTLLSQDAPSNLRQLSISNSFGVPSMTPEVWMPDVELANSYCRDTQLLIVSVIGTEGAGERNLVQDFAYTAAMARDAGAKVIEANLSCPNLIGPAPNRVAGMLYSDAENAGRLAKEIRQSIGKSTPLLLKVGYLGPEQLKTLIEATRPYVNGYSGINTLRGKVRQPNGEFALPGRLKVGLCGAAIYRFARQFLRELESLRRKRKDDFAIIGIGGMMDAHDLEECLQDGADLAMSATAAMWDPYLALRWLALQQRSSR